MVSKCNALMTVSIYLRYYYVSYCFTFVKNHSGTLNVNVRGLRNCILSCNNIKNNYLKKLKPFFCSIRTKEKKPGILMEFCLIRPDKSFHPARETVETFISMYLRGRVCKTVHN